MCRRHVYAKVCICWKQCFVCFIHVRMIESDADCCASTNKSKCWWHMTVAAGMHTIKTRDAPFSRSRAALLNVRRWSTNVEWWLGHAHLPARGILLKLSTVTNLIVWGENRITWCCSRSMCHTCLACGYGRYVHWTKWLSGTCFLSNKYEMYNPELQAWAHGDVADSKCEGCRLASRICKSRKPLCNIGNLFSVLRQ